jgi:hypothetical protein
VTNLTHGQAHAGKKDFPNAVKDLRRAVKLAPGWGLYKLNALDPIA